MGSDRCPTCRGVRLSGCCSVFPRPRHGCWSGVGAGAWLLGPGDAQGPHVRWGLGCCQHRGKGRFCSGSSRRAGALNCRTPKYFPGMRIPHPSRRISGGGEDGAGAAGKLRLEEGPHPFLLRASKKHGWVKPNNMNPTKLAELPSRKAGRLRAGGGSFAPRRLGVSPWTWGGGLPCIQHRPKWGREVAECFGLDFAFSSPFIQARCHVCSGEAWVVVGGGLPWLPSPPLPCACLSVCLSVPIWQ